jgi:hypothetical protein
MVAMVMPKMLKLYGEVMVVVQHLLLQGWE